MDLAGAGGAERAAWRGPIGRRLDALAAGLLWPEGAPAPDFSTPPGEAALFAPDSVAWRVFANPVALLSGGVAAVLMELAHPAVRAGVWEHSRFREDPVGRMRRTGLAAMTTVYAPRGRAEAAIAAVGRRHERVAGLTETGEPYRATDPRLLTWVHATATYGFTAAYDRFVAPLGEAGLSRAFAEAVPTARLYGAGDPPASAEAWRATLAAAEPCLEGSPIPFEFLRIMDRAPIGPTPLRPLQRLAIRGGVEVVPAAVRARLGLGRRHGLRPGEAAVLRAMGVLSERVVPPSHPSVQARRRLAPPMPVAGGPSDPR